MDPVKRAREALNEALRAYQAAAEALEQGAADESVDLEPLERAFDEAKTAYEARQVELERAEKLAEVRAISPVPVPDEKSEERGTQPRITVGNEEPVYRPDVSVSFFRDMALAKRDPIGFQVEAERLRRHNAQAAAEQRADNSTSSTDGGGFIPPQYLGNLYAAKARAGRPFANRVPKLPLPPTGMTMTLPVVSTGVSVASQATENTALSTTAIVEAVNTVEVNTIGGYVEASLQLLERSDPSIDVVYFNDLVGAYDAELDRQLIAGGGTSGEHMGLRSVTGNIDVTYSDSTPTAAELLPKIYDAAQQVFSNRFRMANLVVMHPRRAAWMASSLGTSFPLFQQGNLMQAAGTQDSAFATMLAGLEVVLDPNIATTYSQSGSTNEDEIYVVYVDDMYLAEGPFRTDVFMEPGSAALTARFRGFSYSAFFCERYPKSIANIVGGGLAAPTF